jgi:hypothetical protein
MAKVLTFSRVFPAYHPRKGEPTYFIEKVVKSLGIDALCPVNPANLINCSPKHHTIRAGKRFKAGDYFSPRYWTGSPYNYKRDGSKCPAFAPDTLVVKTFDFEIKNNSFYINGREYDGEIEGHHELLEKIATNDGLSKEDLLLWFKFPKPFSGQIICWNENINY